MAINLDQVGAQVLFRTIKDTVILTQDNYKISVNIIKEIFKRTKEPKLTNHQICIIINHFLKHKDD